VRIHPLEDEVGQRGDARDDVRGVLEADADAAHAGVEREVAAGGDAESAGGFGDGAGLVEARDGDADAGSQSGLEFAGQHGAEEEHGQAEIRGGEGLGELGGGDGGGAGLGESLGDGAHAEAVGAGLEHDDGLERGDRGGDLAVVFGEDVQVDVEHDPAFNVFHSGVPVVYEYTPRSRRRSSQIAGNASVSGE